MTNWNDQIIKDFRENDGKAGGRFEGAKLLLLTTIGAKSGEPRVAPMMYFAEGDHVYVIASKGGSPEHPAWYHNLKANPDVTVQQATDHGVEKYEASATPVAPEKREELWAKFTAKAPQFAEYQTKTDRVIPLIEIRRKP